MRGLTGWCAAVASFGILLVACGTPTSTVTSSRSPASDIEGDTSKLPPLPSPTASATPTASGTAAQVVTAMFNDVQAKWQMTFSAAGLTYSPSVLRIFSSEVGTACGHQTAEVGPFYCPADRTVNLDLTFFAALQQQFGVGGFAWAYIVAHEVAHHVQFLLGITTRVALENQHNPAGQNALSVRVELQADCFAGVWAHSAYSRDLVRPGDIEQALKAAAVVGDDFLSHLRGGQRGPEDWTHGSSAQRQHWFTVGFDSGAPASCDTYSGSV